MPWGSAGPHLYPCRSEGRPSETESDGRLTFSPEKALQADLVYALYWPYHRRLRRARGREPKPVIHDDWRQKVQPRDCRAAYLVASVEALTQEPDAVDILVAAERLANELFQRNPSFGFNRHATRKPKKRTIECTSCLARKWSKSAPDAPAVGKKSGTDATYLRTGALLTAWVGQCFSSRLGIQACYVHTYVPVIILGSPTLASRYCTVRKRRAEQCT